MRKTSRRMRKLVRPNRAAWLTMAALCAAIVQAGAQSEIAPKIAKIDVRHVGPPAVSDSLVRANIRLKEGDDYRRPSVDDDIRQLYATGYFYNIRVGEEIAPEGMKLTYVVQGNPTISTVTFSGNKKYSDSKIRKKVTSKTGEPLSERKLFADALEIQKLYQKAGYQKTTVKPVSSIDENSGRGSVTFEITEAPKVKVKDVIFEGASAFSQRKLRKEMKTRRWWMFSWLTGTGVLKDEQFEEDKDKLAEFYQNEGYVDFRIKDIKIDRPNDKSMILRMSVDEGRQYKVGKVTFTGNKLFTTEQLSSVQYLNEKKKRSKMMSGDTFTAEGLSKTVEAIKDAYGSRGHIDASITPIKRANIQTGTIDIEYVVREAEKILIEKIEIKGNTKTKDKVIRRELAVSPGEVYDAVRVKISKSRLDGLQYFEGEVKTRDEETDVPNRRNLVIGLEEKNTGNFTIGAGFSSVDSIVGFVEVSQGNFDLFHPPTFTGGGQKARLRASVGTLRQDYQLSFIEPWLFGKKLSLGVDLFHRDLQYLSDLYDERRTGGTVSLSRTLWNDFWIGRLSYTLENVDLRMDQNNPGISQEVKNEAGARLVSRVGASIAYDTRGGGLLPNSGQRSELLYEVAGGPFGGDSDFYKIEFKTAWYFKGFAEGHVLEAVAKVGVVDSYGESTRVPLFDRFYLGGLYSLRGFKFRQVGPKDVLNEPIGGGSYYFGSLEYSIPIIERFRFAMFYDVGNVYPDPYTFRLNEWNDNVGIGLRLNLPIGPLRLDYGIPIHNDSAPDGSGRFQFGVGYTREF